MDLHDAVVVVTGASSGIGRAAAKRFAAQGAKVVVTARRTQALADLVTELGRDRALAVPGDMSDPVVAERVATAAVERFGRLDVWVNNASVVAFGRIQDMPPEAFARVIDVNVLGYANGARAAHPHLKASGGTLVQVASLNSRVPAPYYTPYITSKFAVTGMALSLRQEWRSDGISVAVVLPASVDTPLFHTAGNWYGRRVKAIMPANDPDRIARRIVAAARRPRRTMPAGFGARPLLLGEALAPRVIERITALQAPFNNYEAGEPVPPSPGNLFEPSDLLATERGGWAHRTHRLVAMGAVPVAAVAAGVAARVLRR